LVPQKGGLKNPQSQNSGTPESPYQKMGKIYIPIHSKRKKNVSPQKKPGKKIGKPNNPLKRVEFQKKMEKNFKKGPIGVIIHL